MSIQSRMRVLLLQSALAAVSAVMVSCAPPVTYTMAYDANGADSGTVPVDPNAYIANSEVTVMGNAGALSRGGYTFTGWNAMPDGSGASYTGAETLSLGTSDLTLYAKWDTLPTRRWCGVSCSSDFRTLIAYVFNDRLYVSHDYGATWTPGDTTRYWSAVACSGDGMTLAATNQVVSTSCYIAVSTDGGAHWVDTNAVGSTIWALDVSGNGSKIVAGTDSGGFYYSEDSGAHWANRTTAWYWGSLAITRDGSKVASGVDSGVIATTTDLGLNWTESSQTGAWWSISVSDDGRRIAAADYDYSADGVLISSNGGIGWTRVDPSPDDSAWTSIAMSGDGKHIIAVEPHGLCVSNDYGSTWSVRDSTRMWSWTDVSADGRYMVAVVDDGMGSEGDGFIYTSADYGATWTPRY